jgi:hypothetical protein
MSAGIDYAWSKPYYGIQHLNCANPRGFGTVINWSHFTEARVYIWDVHRYIWEKVFYADEHPDHTAAARAAVEAVLKGAI